MKNLINYDILWDLANKSANYKNMAQLFEQLELPQASLYEKTILDAGCGIGWLSVIAALLFKAKIIAVDTSRTAISLTKENCKKSNISIEAYIDDIEVLTNIKNNQIDTILSIGVAHLANSPKKCMETFYRCLSEGGECYVSVIKCCQLTKFVNFFKRIIKLLPSFMVNTLFYICFSLLYICLKFSHAKNRVYGVKTAISEVFHSFEQPLYSAEQWLNWMREAGFENCRIHKTWNFLDHQIIYYGKKQNICKQFLN